MSVIKHPAAAIRKRGNIHDEDTSRLAERDHRRPCQQSSVRTPAHFHSNSQRDTGAHIMVAIRHRVTLPFSREPGWIGGLRPLSLPYHSLRTSLRGVVLGSKFQSKGKERAKSAHALMAYLAGTLASDRWSNLCMPVRQ
jgi:hypothetical protein